MVVSKESDGFRPIEASGDGFRPIADDGFRPIDDGFRPIEAASLFGLKETSGQPVAMALGISPEAARKLAPARAELAINRRIKAAGEFIDEASGLKDAARDLEVIQGQDYRRKAEIAPWAVQFGGQGTVLSSGGIGALRTLIPKDLFDAAAIAASLSPIIGKPAAAIAGKRVAAMTADEIEGAAIRLGQIGPAKGQVPMVEAFGKTKLKGLTPDDVAAHVAELARAGKIGMVKPIMGKDMKSAVLNTLEGATRGRLRSEQLILGLGDNSDAAMHKLANETIRKIKAGDVVGPDETVKVMDWLVERMESGQIPGDVIADFFGDERLGLLLKTARPETQVQIAEATKRAISSLGYGLGQISRIRKVMAKSLTPEANAIIDASGGFPSAMDNIYKWLVEAYRPVTNFRKAAITSATEFVARDALSNHAIYALNVIEDAMNGALANLTAKAGILPRKIKPSDWFAAAKQDIASAYHPTKFQVLKGVGRELKFAVNNAAKGDARSAFEDVVHAMHVLGPKNRKDVQSLLERFPIEAMRLVETPLIDITGGRMISKFVSPLGSVNQEYHMKIALDGFLRNRARLRGVSVSKLGLSDVQEAVVFAQKQTLSYNFKGTVIGHYLDLYRKAPWLDAVAQTFPRAWANIIHMMYTLSPFPVVGDAVGLAAASVGKLTGSKALKAIGQGTVDRLLSPDPKIAFGKISKSLEGSALIATGWYLGVNQNFGGKVYDLVIQRLPDGKKRTVDLRRNQPIAGPLIIGGLMGNAFGAFSAARGMGMPDEEAVNAGLATLFRVTPNEWSELFISMKRTELSGIPLIDAVLSSSEFEKGKKVAAVAQKFIGGFLTSFEPSLWTKTPSMVMGQWNQIDRTPKFVRDRPLMGQAIQHIPFYSRRLPARNSPMRAGVEEIDKPLQRQVTGFVTRVKTKAELEADRLGLTFRDIYPLSINPAYDNLVAGYMGPMVEQDLGELMASPVYLNPPSNKLFTPEEFRKWKFAGLVGKFKKIAQKEGLGDLSTHDRLEVMAQRSRKLVQRALLESIEDSKADAENAVKKGWEPE